MYEELTIFLCITIILFYSEHFLMYPLSQFLHNSIIKSGDQLLCKLKCTNIARDTKTEVTGI